MKNILNCFLVMIIIILFFLSCSEDNNPTKPKSEAEKFYGRWNLEKLTFHTDSTSEVIDITGLELALVFKKDGVLEVYDGTQLTSTDQWEILNDSRLKIIENQEEIIFDYEISESDLILTITESNDDRLVYEFKKQ